MPFITLSAVLVALTVALVQGSVISDTIPYEGHRTLSAASNKKAVISAGLTFNHFNHSLYSNPLSKLALRSTLAKMLSGNGYVTDIQFQTVSQTPYPTKGPTRAPTFKPTLTPTIAPSLVPTIAPSFVPTIAPTTARRILHGQFPTYIEAIVTVLFGDPTLDEEIVDIIDNIFLPKFDNVTAFAIDFNALWTTEAANFGAPTAHNELSNIEAVPILYQGYDIPWTGDNKESYITTRVFFIHMDRNNYADINSKRAVTRGLAKYLTSTPTVTGYMVDVSVLNYVLVNTKAPTRSPTRAPTPARRRLEMNNMINNDENTDYLGIIPYTGYHRQLHDASYVDYLIRIVYNDPVNDNQLAPIKTHVSSLLTLATSNFTALNEYIKIYQTALSAPVANFHVDGITTAVVTPTNTPVSAAATDESFKITEGQGVGVLVVIIVVPILALIALYYYCQSNNSNKMKRDVEFSQHNPIDRHYTPNSRNV